MSTLSITSGGYKSDYRNITNVIFPTSRAAFAVYQRDIGDSCLLCPNEAEIHRFGTKRTKATIKKEREREEERVKGRRNGRSKAGCPFAGGRASTETSSRCNVISVSRSVSPIQQV